MNDDPSTPRPSSDDQPAEPQAESSAAGENHEANPERDATRDAFEDLVRSAKDAFTAGARDARDAARTAIPKAREGFGKGLHDLAYGLAYGLSFGATLAREITPENLKKGFTEGGGAGREAAEHFVDRRRQAAAARDASVAPSDDPADTEGPQHGGFGDDEGEQSGGPVFV